MPDWPNVGPLAGGVLPEEPRRGVLSRVVGFILAFIALRLTRKGRSDG